MTESLSNAPPTPDQPIPDQPVPAPMTPIDSPTVVATVDEMRDALKDVYDPEIPINIVDLGLVYKLEEQDGVVSVAMTLTSPQCPLSDQIKARVVHVLSALKGVNAVNVNFVFDPLWTKENLTFEGRLQASMFGII
ncbi:MAG: metal-sulfur cluster assembly factor [Planctomycetota bacterium]